MPPQDMKETSVDSCSRLVQLIGIQLMVTITDAVLACRGARRCTGHRRHMNVLVDSAILTWDAAAGRALSCASTTEKQVCN